jgi:plasmid stabilization system protein ParE
MAKVIWAPAALRDLDSIAVYIADDSPDRAALFVSRLIEATDPLAQFPRSGRCIPEMDDPVWREIVVGAYRIMYRLESDVVWISAIVHGARQSRESR